MDTVTFTIDTGHDLAVVNITAQLESFLGDIKAADGLLNVFVPHATAGATIMEVEPGTMTDAPRLLQTLLPRDDRWAHDHGSPGHGADHLLPILVSPSVTVPVAEGAMLLGTWQSVVLIDPNVDNPRRTVRLSFLHSGSTDHEEPADKK